ncbi:MAG: hypothetical protein QXU32_07575 [Nitrososphaerales archaeon]
MVLYFIVLPVFIIWWATGARAILIDNYQTWRKAILFIFYLVGMILTIAAFINLETVSAFFFSSVPAAALVVLTIGTFIICLILYSVIFVSGESVRQENPVQRNTVQRRTREEMLFRNRQRQREERRRNLENSILGVEDTDARQEAWRAIDDMEQRDDLR